MRSEFANANVVNSASGPISQHQGESKMRICGTCHKPLDDQIEICSHCQMNASPYDSPLYPKEYRHYHQWTLFPSIPKTHWWGSELAVGPSGTMREVGSILAKSSGIVAIGPQQLNLGTGFYEFHGFFKIDSIPGREVEVGTFRVLGDNDMVLAPILRRIKGADFDVRSKEAHVSIEFQVNLPSENIRCELKSNDKGQRLGFSLTWVRLVPKSGWRWNRWDGKSFEYDPKAAVRKSDVEVTLKPYLENDGPEVWGPYIYLSSGFYQLNASISANPSAQVSWHVFSAGRELIYREPIKLDPSQHDQRQTVTRNFYLDGGCREVEFRIFVEQGQVTIYWIRLTPPEGPIWERYYELGGRDSVLGLPTSTEGRADPSDTGVKGRYRRFERGTIYFNNSTYEAWEVWGAIGNHFEHKLGGTAGFGFPAGPIQPITSSQGTIGEAQHFQGQVGPDRAIFAYPSDRTYTYSIRGATGSKYWKTDEDPRGSLGFPTKEGEFDWLRGGVLYKRSDFERGYITFRLGESVHVHYYPKPHVEVECPNQIVRGEELIINVIGDLEGGPSLGAWCTISFPDLSDPNFDTNVIRIFAAENTLKDISKAKKWDPTWGNYARNPGMVLQYPRIELGRWESDWPLPPANRFQVRLRPSRSGLFRIYARFTAQDAFDSAIIRGDPDPEWIEGAQNRYELGMDPDRKLDVVRDQQDEAVYVYVTQVIDPPLSRQDERFDVFLCYNNEDKPAVKRIGELLKAQGIQPWLDEWQLRPGVPWLRVLEEQILQIRAVAVFVGKDGIGPWQQMEMEAFLRQFVNQGCPVIPVLLENASEEPILPVFLRGMMWVDFRQQDPNPLNQLIWGITGQHDQT